MNLTRDELWQKVGHSWTTILTYLDRPEFKHIKKHKRTDKRHSYIYMNITNEDIQKIKDYIGHKKGIYCTDFYSFRSPTK